MTHISNEFLLARDYIYSLEDIILLNNTNINYEEVKNCLEKFKHHAQVYQPEKGDRGRYCLDLVASDKYDANQSLQDNYELTEMSFTDDTIYLDSMHSLKSFIHKFDYGRAHAIYMDAGGYFPPHRDGPTPPKYEDECFRILIPIEGCEENDFCFVNGGQVLPLINGNAYYINTFKRHYAFSFTDRCKMIILNMRISMENAKVMRNLIG